MSDGLSCRLGCVTCLVALHIETVLDPTEPPITKSLTVTYIRRSELILQKICEVIPAMERNLRHLHRYLDQKRIDAAMTVDMSPVEPAESLKEGDVRVQEAQQSGIDTQDSGQVDMNEPRPSLTNSEIRLPVDEASEGLGDMDDWLDGLLWLDYLKDSTLMPN